MGSQTFRRKGGGLRLLLASLALGAFAGCGRGRDGGAGLPPPPLRAGGPGVAVRLADAPAVRLLVPPDATILAAGSAVAGRAAAPDGSLVASLEGNEIRLGAWRGPGPIEIRPGGAPLGIERPRDPPVPGPPERRTYRGSFRVTAGSGSIGVSNELTLEEYLAGVVGSEMPASSSPMDALKAQAVASRTYALYALLRAAEGGRAARFAPDDSFQVYSGQAGEHRRVLRAVSETAGEVLTYRGGLFRAYFHSTCGGRTVDASRLFGEPEIAPLGGVACAACKGSAFFRWEERARAADIEDALRAWAAGRGVALGRLAALEVSETTPEGRAAYLGVRHAGGSFEVGVERFRALLRAAGAPALRSASFRVSAEEGAFRFDGGGFGHGAGLCQIGAVRLGAGQTYREILAAYYPGSEVERVY